MLHKANPIPQSLVPSEKPTPVPVPAPVVLPAQSAVVAAVSTPQIQSTVDSPQSWNVNSVGSRNSIPVPVAAPQSAPSIFSAAGGDIDHRTVVDPRLSRMGDQDLRVPPASMVQPPQPVPPVLVRDPRENSFSNDP